jgi:nicotinamide riboside transporter PnuC
MEDVMDYMAGVLIVCGILAVGRKHRWGFLVITVGAIISCVLQWNAGIEGLALESVFVVAANLYGWKQWGKDAT